MAEPSPATVLIVDDDEMITTSLKTLLQLDTDYTVLTFTSPREALECASARPVDVIVADFLMPGMDGLALLKAVRDRQPETTRILLTGYADKDNAIRAINETGLYYYLEKPWDNEHLSVIIRNGVERSSLFRKLRALVADLEKAHDRNARVITRLFDLVK